MMNDDILKNNKIAYTFLFAGFASFFMFFITGFIAFFIASPVCAIVWFIMQNPSRYCDYCGNYLQYVNQQLKIEDNIACKTCDRKYRNGKIGANETRYKHHVNKNGYGK